jgi:diamine N-acetyltransferase
LGKRIEKTGMSIFPSEVSFRRGTVDDLSIMGELMPLYYQDDHLHYDEAKAQKTIREFLSTPSLGEVWMIEVSNFAIDSKKATQHVIGYIALAYGFSIEFGGREAFIDEFFIREEYRGKGFGSQALTHVIEVSRTNGIVGLRLEVTPTNSKALKLYERVGFKNLDRSLLAIST